MLYKYIIKKIKDFLREIRLLLTKKLYDKGRGFIQLGDNFILENNIKSVVIVNKTGKIGDMVVTSFIFRELKKNYPYLILGVIARGNAKEVIKYNLNVDKIFDYNKKNLDNLAKEISDEEYDLLLFMTEEVKEKEMRFIGNCKAKFNCGINKIGWNLFNLSIEEGKDFKYNDHLTVWYKSLLSKIGIKREIDTSYDLYLGEQREQKIMTLVEKFKNDNILLLNPYGAGELREFKDETTKKIIQVFKKLGWKVIILYYGDKYKKVQELSLAFDNVIVPEKIETILDSSIYVKIADMVITPDTGIVHIASAYNKKIIAVYQYPKTQLTEWSDYKIWYPHTKNKCKVIFPEGKLSKYNIDNDTIDINNFDFIEMEAAIKYMVLE